LTSVRGGSILIELRKKCNDEKITDYFHRHFDPVLVHPIRLLDEKKKHTGDT